MMRIMNINGKYVNSHEFWKVEKASAAGRSVVLKN